MRSCKLCKPKSQVPATVDFVDIAGLVRGASHGEGKGNAFLSHIRDSDAIAHVVRCFEDPNIVHVDGRVDPLADIETINTELILKDLDSVQKPARPRAARGQGRRPDGARDGRGVRAARARARTRASAPRSSPVEEEREKLALRELQLITSKPMFYVANVREDQLGKLDSDPLVAKVRARAAEENTQSCVVCAAIEAEIMQLPPERPRRVPAIGRARRSRR